MPVNRSQKEEILQDLKERARGAKSVFFAKNLGMSVVEVQNLRRKVREVGASFRVAKKTLIKKAIKDELGIEIDDAALEGAVGATFSREDEIAPLKTLAAIAKLTEKIELTGAVFEGKVMTKAQTIALSQIPSREELLAKLLGTMVAPLSGFVGMGNAIIGGFVRVLDGYRKQKES